jgi:four helix bundle protein
MRTDNIIQTKSFNFAIRIVSVYKFLLEEKKEYTLSKQLLRAGTSIGANIEESIGGQSEKDFIAKITIAYKETRETIYWIKLLKATDYLSSDQAQSLLSDADELCRIIGKIQISMKNKS